MSWQRGLEWGESQDKWDTVRASHLKRMLTLTINIMLLEEPSGSRWRSGRPGSRWRSGKPGSRWRSGRPGSRRRSGRPWEVRKTINRNESNPCNEAIDLRWIFCLCDQKYYSNWTTVYQVSYIKHNTFDRIIQSTDRMRLGNEKVKFHWLVIC